MKEGLEYKDPQPEDRLQYDKTKLWYALLESTVTKLDGVNTMLMLVFRHLSTPYTLQTYKGKLIPFN